MQRIVVRHDAIEGLRDASNFEFPVRDSKDMEGLSVGDEIRAVVFVQGRKYWLGEIEVVSTKNGDRR
jgi:Cu/Ag efflux protein CusF